MTSRLFAIYLIVIHLSIESKNMEVREVRGQGGERCGEVVRLLLGRLVPAQ